MITRISANKSTAQAAGADLHAAAGVRREALMPAHLYPRISATSPALKRDMVWQDLLKCGAAGATAMELAAHLIKDRKATGTVSECALALEPLLAELVRMPGAHRTTRDGDRYKARRQEA